MINVSVINMGLSGNFLGSCRGKATIEATEATSIKYSRIQVEQA